MLSFWPLVTQVSSYPATINIQGKSWNKNEQGFRRILCAQQIAWKNKLTFCLITRRIRKYIEDITVQKVRPFYFSHTPLPVILTFPFFCLRLLCPKHQFVLSIQGYAVNPPGLSWSFLLPFLLSMPVISSKEAIAFTPSVCVLSRPANDFFWDAAHT